MASTANTVRKMPSKRIDVAAGQISPGYTQSTACSEAASSSISSSSPGPSTPPSRERTSRSRTRNDSRPLHRRGKSRCLETLEDLLREAGYEETRISTPEAEEVKGEKSGMGAVVEFLSQFLPTSTSTSPETEQSTYYSRPTSTPPTPSEHATEEDTTPRQTMIAGVHDHLEHLQKSYEKGTSPSERNSRGSQATVRPSLVQPKPSRAGDYLRTYTSRASLMLPPERPSSTPARSRAPFSIKGRRKTDDDDDDPSIIFSKRGNGEAEDEVTYYQERGQPPLPPSWLETVTKAVLSGGHVGRPTSDATVVVRQKNVTTQPPTLRPSRSTLPQSTSTSQPSAKHPPIRRGLTDQTNLNMPPPPLFMMLERGRAGRSESQVTRTRVVCRSAPGSRATSLARRGSENGRGRVQRRKILKKGDTDDRVPSLARHHTEDDAWNGGRGVPSTANDVKNMYLSGGSDIVALPAGEASSDEEDDHGGELDLARMLVHPKRQNSIRSLRKHLHTGEGVYGARRVAQPKKSPLHDDDDWPYADEDLGSGYMSRRGVADDEDEGDAQAFAKFVGAFDNGRERPPLPTWATRR